MADDMVGGTQRKWNRREIRKKKKIVAKLEGKLLFGETDVSKMVDNIMIYFEPQDTKIWIFSNSRNRTNTFHWHF